MTDNRELPISSFHFFFYFNFAWVKLAIHGYTAAYGQFIIFMQERIANSYLNTIATLGETLYKIVQLTSTVT